MPKGACGSGESINHTPEYIYTGTHRGQARGGTMATSSILGVRRFGSGGGQSRRLGGSRTGAASWFVLQRVVFHHDVPRVSTAGRPNLWW